MLQHFVIPVIRRFRYYRSKWQWSAIEAELGIIRTSQTAGSGCARIPTQFPVIDVPVTGGVAEWFKALVLKTSEGGTLP